MELSGHTIRLEHGAVCGEKILDVCRPIRKRQIRHLRMTRSENRSIGVELWHRFIRRPLIEALHGGRVLARLKVRSHEALQ
jgi:hypothetical protein